MKVEQLMRRNVKTCQSKDTLNGSLTPCFGVARGQGPMSGGS
jgi:hypothetical protein